MSIFIIHVYFFFLFLFYMDHVVWNKRFDWLIGWDINTEQWTHKYTSFFTLPPSTVDKLNFFLTASNISLWLMALNKLQINKQLMNDEISFNS
jgi:hypothetical protein